MNAIGMPVCTFRSLTRMVNKYAEVKTLSFSALGFSDLTALCVESIHMTVVLSSMIYRMINNSNAVSVLALHASYPHTLSWNFEHQANK
jgi:hypothetical protein